VLIVCDPRTVHRADLVRIRELIVGAGGTVLGAVTHTESRRREAAGSRRGNRRRGSRTPAARPAPPAARTAPDAGADPERDLNADGSTTIALRTVRSGDR
jgi:hypothetical protein